MACDAGRGLASGFFLVRRGLEAVVGGAFDAGGGVFLRDDKGVVLVGSDFEMVTLDSSIDFWKVLFGVLVGVFWQ